MFSSLYGDLYYLLFVAQCNKCFFFPFKGHVIFHTLTLRRPVFQVKHPPTLSHDSNPTKYSNTYVEPQFTQRL
jgi:hypothetical protein